MNSGKYIDLSGKRFGRLVAIEKVDVDTKRGAYWKCQCDCGRETIVMGRSLRTGATKSCGCLHDEVSTRRIVDRNTTHGKTHTRLYSVWQAMIRRCEREKSKEYKNYGARGIKVCDEWREDFDSFYSWALENGYNPSAKRGECTIDGVDNNGPYSPENCRIATISDQQRNKRTNKLITHKGETKTQTEWARIYGRSETIFCGMSEDEIEAELSLYDKYLESTGKKMIPKQVTVHEKVKRYWINDGAAEKLVSQDEGTYYLNNGWVIGRAKRRKGIVM